jgi:fucose 4-O-acetylase-like acetyltransferase
MEQSNQRSCLIDNGKGVFIILVLLAHTPPIFNN